MNAKTRPSFERYRRQSLHYMENAQVFLQRNDASKAGELLWGGLSQAIKAVAATKGRQLKTHGDIWNFMRGITKELQDEEMFSRFLAANHLHSNFYESELTVEQVASFVDGIKEIVARLLSLLPEPTQP